MAEGVRSFFNSLFNDAAKSGVDTLRLSFWKSASRAVF